ncbi:group 1 glycosyl transferase [Striga asiatica]|uniref:Group 1 glycosyl transferase n=1 Tax=Striga asiatica TaxID=4170 RepID=A0A5A7PZ92_STRAF|nr:group 1 glycosyl transferase [Striga asiatica]
MDRREDQIQSHTLILILNCWKIHLTAQLRTKDWEPLLTDPLAAKYPNSEKQGLPKQRGLSTLFLDQRTTPLPNCLSSCSMEGLESSFLGQLVSALSLESLALG